MKKKKKIKMKAIVKTRIKITIVQMKNKIMIVTKREIFHN